ncbi:hypothetical protein XELAEV_18022094mg [Xenopus laevis]|uniref:Uncharacterized protein n=1 Tax=Xenopus laevis TaxID=8355 RepID=A0A974HNC3_XENLA|nr:hypothetical protein XELAEV_18022094mg [Xenopus laevis]
MATAQVQICPEFINEPRCLCTLPCSIHYGVCTLTGNNRFQDNGPGHTNTHTAYISLQFPLCELQNTLTIDSLNITCFAL